VIPILFGLVTAALWASTLLGSSRSARLIGSWSTLGWVMLIGLTISIPVTLLTSPAIAFSDSELFHLIVAGIANSAGLLFVYTALQRGKVAVVGPIVSTEGAIGATLAILNGDPVTAVGMAVLALIVVGVVLAAIERQVPVAPAPDVASNAVAYGDGIVLARERPATADFGRPTPVSAPLTAAIALGGAILFGINLYATSRIASELPIAWAILPARVAGVIGVTIPLIAMRRIRLTRPAVPFLLLVGTAEVVGTATFAIGARESAAVTSVIASQFAAIAAIFAFLVFGERLTKLQTAGVITIAIGVAALSIVQS
jgi:drug/metabolite transporter (DMT)-like permease